ncbi:MAG: radical SAM protein [Candidatus Tectomicrobia bacterium]|nr:radical SAM protein [Candidatus Tectomicrobia bacterium]
MSHALLSPPKQENPSHAGADTTSGGAATGHAAPLSPTAAHSRLTLRQRLDRWRRFLKVGLLQGTTLGKRWLRPELLSLTVELCRACNLRCTYCAMHGEVADRNRIHLPSTYFLDPALLETILKDLDAARTKIPLNLSYSGEALLHPRFVEIMNLLGRRGHASICGFTTNGMLLDEARSAAIVRNGIGEVCISVDGDGEGHELRRRRSAYSRIMANVLRLIELRDAAGSSRPRVTLKAVAGGCSSADFEAFLQTYLPKVQRITLIPEIPVHQQVRLPYRGLPSCSFPFTSLTVASDGAVALCCFDVGGMAVRDLRLNVRERGILEVFHGPEMTALRRAMLERRADALPRLCRGCTAYDTVGAFRPGRYALIERSSERTVYTSGMATTYLPGRRGLFSTLLGRWR